MKLSFKKLLINLPKIALILISLVCLLVFPKEIAEGVKKGLCLSGESVIPALFPFMILSAYISASPYSLYFSKKTDKFARSLFNISGAGLTAVLLGILGGYPIGAKTAEDFYMRKVLSKNDTHRTLSWCVNPSPAFVITAVGTFMLGNTKSGVIMYISILLSSFTIGLFMRFTGDKEEAVSFYDTITPIDSKSIFVNSVASASKSMLAICGWVIFFSAVCAGLDAVTDNKSFTLFVKALAEVTTGCENAVNEGISVPLICALLGFGGFAVIFQIAPYLQNCAYHIKLFICWRAITGALSAFYCSILLKIFPQTQAVSQTILSGSTEITLSHSIGASAVLLLTCIVLILEVDNKRKVW